MLPYLSTLSEKERNQLRAALVLWQQIAENSRTHPSRMYKVKDMFVSHPPLDKKEIDALLWRPELNA